MCSCNELLGACHYRDEAEYQAECELIDHENQTEHDVLDMLHGDSIDPSPRALAFVALILTQTAGAEVLDVLTADRCIYWWTKDGTQHTGMLDTRRIRLAA